MALVTSGIHLDVIGSDAIDSPEMHGNSRLKFRSILNSNAASASVAAKGWRVFTNYTRLVGYAASAGPRVFHILWNYKFQYFDRTLLMLYYKCLGKKIVFTAHNVNDAKRDANDSELNRLTLRLQYRFSDHIFVHTEKMKSELQEEFGVPGRKVTVIPFGINNSVPDTELTPEQAKAALSIRPAEKTILFFGRIGAYKGLKYLVDAFLHISTPTSDYRLLVVGQTKRGSEGYLAEIQQTIDRSPYAERVTRKIEFVPDEDTELYFKAADVLVLPYTQIFQSGVIFLGYSFGLPVIATDVGSFREEIIEGQTGFVCRPHDAADLGSTIVKYFESDLFANLSNCRSEIRRFAQSRHSWDVVSEMTRRVYSALLQNEVQ